MVDQIFSASARVEAPSSTILKRSSHGKPLNESRFDSRLASCVVMPAADTARDGIGTCDSEWWLHGSSNGYMAAVAA